MVKKAKVYSTPSCPYCVMAKDFLEEKGVEVEYIDVSKDQEAAKEMVEKSKQMGVPVIEMEGEIVVGFDRERLKELIEK